MPASVDGTLPQHRVTKLSPRPAGAELAHTFEDALWHFDYASIRRQTPHAHFPSREWGSGYLDQTFLDSSRIVALEETAWIKPCDCDQNHSNRGIEKLARPQSRVFPLAHSDARQSRRDDRRRNGDCPAGRCTVTDAPVPDTEWLTAGGDIRRVIGS